MLVHGGVSYILPCLGRIEVDRQKGKPQDVSVEDFTACIHGSHGYAEPASGGASVRAMDRRSFGEGCARAQSKSRLGRWVADNGRIRDAIERTYPEQFKDFNKRMWQPGGFHRPLPPVTGMEDQDRQSQLYRAAKPHCESRPIRSATNLSAHYVPQPGPVQHHGIFGSRPLPRRARHAHGSVHERERIVRLELREGEIVGLRPRSATMPAAGSTASSCTPTTFRQGCLGGYYPECNPLIPLWHHAKGSFVPASKGIPVLIEKTRATPSS